MPGGSQPTPWVPQRPKRSPHGVSPWSACRINTRRRDSHPCWNKKRFRESASCFPRARKAREWLPRFLEERGARVDLAVVYETRRADENAGLLREILGKEKLDYLAFTSSSTVSAFTALAGSGPTKEAWQKITAACIGEITAETARTEGFQHILTACPSTIPGLVKAIEDHVEGKG